MLQLVRASSPQTGGGNGSVRLPPRLISAAFPRHPRPTAALVASAGPIQTNKSGWRSIGLNSLVFLLRLHSSVPAGQSSSRTFIMNEDGLVQNQRRAFALPVALVPTIRPSIPPSCCSQIPETRLSGCSIFKFYHQGEYRTVFVVDKVERGDAQPPRALCEHGFVFFVFLTFWTRIHPSELNLTLSMRAAWPNTSICCHGEPGHPTDKELEFSELRRHRCGKTVGFLHNRKESRFLIGWCDFVRTEVEGHFLQGWLLLFRLCRSAEERATASDFDLPQVGAPALWRFWSTSTAWRRRRRRRSPWKSITPELHQLLPGNVCLKQTLFILLCLRSIEVGS